jgi:PrtD family type I secretion system ABC transporter
MPHAIDGDDARPASFPSPLVRSDGGPVLRDQWQRVYECVRGIVERAKDAATTYRVRCSSTTDEPREKPGDQPGDGPKQPPLRAAVGAFRGALFGVGVASGVVNLLALTGPLFMLQLYDRVLPSRSVPTLVGLAIIAVTLFAFQGMLDALRGRVLVRIGRELDERLSPQAFDLTIRLSLNDPSAESGLQSLRDVENLRSFTSSAGLLALFDLPWMPFYVLVCYLFHPLIGLAVFVAAAIMCLLALLTELRTRQPSRESVAIIASRRALAEAARRNAPLLRALGMQRPIARMWEQINRDLLQKQQQSSDILAGSSSAARLLRVVVQSGILGLGAYLVIVQEATAGVMLAAAILSVRALAPIEQAIANWRGFVIARQSWQRLSELLDANPNEDRQIELPRPSRNLRLVAVTLVPPRRESVVLNGVTFSLSAGSALGVVGPTGSGKSSLARALVGVWQPARGAIRLDGATPAQYGAEAMGRFTGYLPQEVELFDGTVADNIARFEPNPDSRAVIAAAIAAGVHEAILQLPRGYKTEVGTGGALLSGGQRQWIALARALYGDPFLVVLDEPNSNLDSVGENALNRAIQGVRKRGGIAIVIAHRPNVLTAMDFLLVLNEGHVQALGPRDQILPKVLRSDAGPVTPIREAAGDRRS